MTADLQSAVQRALSAWDTTTLKTNGDGMLSEAMESLRAEFDCSVQAPAEGDATLTEEQIDRFIPERIGVRNWGKPEQADLFNRGQVRDAIRTAIASQPNVQPKAAEVDAAPWSKTVESAALLLQRCTGLELQDCENLAGTILGMAANVQPKGTAADHATVEQWEAALSAVMPADFKDWWQNSRSEWPAVAAGVIESQRADRDMGWEMAAKAAQAPAPAPGLNSDDFLQLSAEVWPADAPRTGERAWWPAQLKTQLCPRMADLTHFGALVEREVLRRVSESQAPAVGADDEQDAAKYRHWRDHAEVLCAVLRYESPAWIDAYLAEALAERDASKPPVQPMGGE